jgi:dynein heavy chain
MVEDINNILNSGDVPNIRLCVCLSPLGEAFRNRLRNFPSLVNCCTLER